MAPEPEDRIALMAQLLSLVERPVARICHDPFQLRIDIASPEGHTLILEGTTTLHTDDLPDWEGEPEGHAGLEHTRALDGAMVLGTQISPEGALRLDLTDGQWISTRAAEDFEAWEIHTDDGLLAVCMPGGGLALWSEGWQTHEG